MKMPNNLTTLTEAIFNMAHSEGATVLVCTDAAKMVSLPFSDLSRPKMVHCRVTIAEAMGGRLNILGNMIEPRGYVPSSAVRERIVANAELIRDAFAGLSREWSAELRVGKVLSEGVSGGSHTAKVGKGATATRKGGSEFHRLAHCRNLLLQGFNAPGGGGGNKVCV